MSDTVWLVSSGDYSDYRVHCVFASKEAAEAFCERENAADSWGGYGAEERPLYTAVPPSWLAYHARADMNDVDGTLADFEVTERRTGWDESEDDRTLQLREGVTRLFVHYRRSDDEARKALQDLAARVRAEREGIA